MNKVEETKLVSAFDSLINVTPLHARITLDFHSQRSFLRYTTIDYTVVLTWLCMDIVYTIDRQRHRTLSLLMG